MTVNYTTNLALGQPVTGTESGTWGDDVNNSVTSYLDIAIAGGLSVTVTVADVTLVLTQGTSSATNIGSTTAQYAILNVSGAMTAARNLILPSSSRQYVINNNTTGGFALTVKGSATSGVTMVNGESAHIYWNGSDYAKAANTAGVATFTSLTLSGGTANGVTYLNGSKVLTSGSALTFDGTNFATTGSISSTIASKTAQFNAAGGSIYASFADGTKTWRFGAGIQSAGTVSLYNATDAVTAYTVDATGNVGIGTTSNLASSKLDVRGRVRVGSGNSSGDAELIFSNYASATTAWDVAVRQDVGGANNDLKFLRFDSSGTYQGIAMQIDSAAGNVGIGTSSPTVKLQVAGGAAIQGAQFPSAGAGIELSYNSGSGLASIQAYDRTGAAWKDIEINALTQRFGTSGTERMRIDSSGNVGIGVTNPTYKLNVLSPSASAAFFQTTSTATWAANTSDTVFQAYNSTTTNNATALYGAAVNYGDGTYTGVKFGAIASGAYSADFVVANRNGGTFQENVRITASGNLLVGTTSATTYTGNSVIVAQGGASPGGANVSIQHISGSSSGNYYLGFNLNGAGIGSVTQSGTTAVLYNVTSDQRLKENIVDAPDFGSVIDSLQVRSFDWKADQTHQRAGFVAQELVTVAPEAVHQPTDPEEMMAVDYSKLVPMLVKEIQSLRKRLADAGIA